MVQLECKACLLLVYVGRDLCIQENPNSMQTASQSCVVAQDIERAYNNNPYHNNIHAADVTQTLGCFLANDHFAQKLTDLEMAAMIFATCIHDVGHPGAVQLSI